jgi:hypothetical protein
MASFNEENRAAPKREEVLYNYSSRSSLIFPIPMFFPSDEKLSRPDLFHFL